MNLAAAGHLWLLAAKALSFTNNLVEEATADAEFPDNAGLILVFFLRLRRLHRLGRSIQANQHTDWSQKLRVGQGTEFAKATQARKPPPF